MKKGIATAEAAKILGVSAQRVRDLARAGRIEGKKHGRDWLVGLASINEYKNRPETRGRKKKSGPEA